MQPFLAVTLVSLTLVFATAQAASVPSSKRSLLYYNHFGAAKGCDIEGNIVPHGSVFNYPGQSNCLQFQCYHGSPTLYSEGCEGQSRSECHAVGATWREKCVTYICTKTTRGGYNYFQPIVLDARCHDVTGRCRSPGEQFRYRLYGQVYNSCRCAIQGHKINYRCY